MLHIRGVEKDHDLNGPNSQCVAVCCSVLHCATACSSVLQCVDCVAVYCSAFQSKMIAACPPLAFNSLIERVLQCVAVCCILLHCVTVCCNVLQCVAMCCSVLQCVAVCCSVLQYIAVKEYSCMPSHRHQLVDRTCVADCHSVLHVLRCVAMSCSVLQCVAVCCSVLQCVAVCCSVLQHLQ